MDDGFQNFTLAKDLSIVVVDAETGFGNGRMIPAGPLRETVAQGLARADAVSSMGDGNPDLRTFPDLSCARTSDRGWRRNSAGRRVVAFAGIGRPEKFFASLEAAGAIVTGDTLLRRSSSLPRGELARLDDAGAAAHSWSQRKKTLCAWMPGSATGIATLPVRAAFDDEAALDTAA